MWSSMPNRTSSKPLRQKMPCVLTLACVVATSAARAQPDTPRPAVVPSDGMNISVSTTFVPGTYLLPNGVNIVSDDVTLDLNGAVLRGLGNGTGIGVSVVGRTGVTVTSSATNGTASLTGYYYGALFINSSGFTLSNLDLSYNWADPNANSTWLDINCPPDLTDRTNLGGGAFVFNAQDSTISNCTASYQENGFDVYNSSGITITGCTASHNVGWGVHFHATTGSTLAGNLLDYNTRQGLGDSAGILLVYGSSYNRILENSCQYSGDGFFIGNEHGCPSNFNTIAGNDCSHAGANAFEATFSNGNIFRGNRASYSSYGFWLGYSYNTTVEDNEILGNGWGVDIDHGQHNSIQRNLFANTNGPAVQLTSDGSYNFPQPCLALPNQTVSSTTSIIGNRFIESNNYHIVLVNTTDSSVYDNYFAGNLRPGTISADALTTRSTVFQVGPQPVLLAWPARNVVGGQYLAGNWYVDYTGKDNTGRGIGDTNVPYTANGAIIGGGDGLPLKIPNSP